MRFPMLAKGGAIALVGWMVLVALLRIEGLVAERALRAGEAVRSVEQSHAAAQAVVGPLLQRACTEEWTTETGTAHVVASEKRAFTLTQAPARLAIDSRTKADPLYRGLFKVNAYVGHADVGASFANLAPLQPQAEHVGGRVKCEAPVLFVALSDVRGVRNASVTMDDAGVDVAPGTTSEKYPHGFHAPLPPSRADGDAAARPLEVKLSLDLIGTGQLAWVPAAGSTSWALASDWPHPSFGGQFVPEQRTVRADGFGAAWNLSALATSAPSDVLRGQDLCVPNAIAADAAADGGASDAKPANCLDTMSVAFIDPVNPYVLSSRAVKYDLLFVALTFIAVGLIEVLSGRRVHPVQYLLVGMALSLFFLLLLSLSEHLVFETAYAIAAAACALLLGAYAASMLGRRLAGAAFGAGIALLYGLLYALLQLEQNALAIGSVMLFAALAAVMLLTRRIDWYALFARLRQDGAQPAIGEKGAR